MTLARLPLTLPVLLRFWNFGGGGGGSVNYPSANNVMEVEDDNEVMVEEVKRVFFLKSQH